MKPPAVDDRPRAVLAIDTATAAGSVALRVGDRTRDRELGWRASFREVAPRIEELMGEVAYHLMSRNRAARKRWLRCA